MVLDKMDPISRLQSHTIRQSWKVDISPNILSRGNQQREKNECEKVSYVNCLSSGPLSPSLMCIHLRKLRIMVEPGDDKQFASLHSNTVCFPGCIESIPYLQKLYPSYHDEILSLMAFMIIQRIKISPRSVYSTVQWQGQSCFFYDSWKYPQHRS